jgi:hypothetical protein
MRLYHFIFRGCIRGAALRQLPLDAGFCTAIVLKGRDAILDRASLLEEFASVCGQAGAMHWLGYFLRVSGSRRKHPHLVVFLKHGTDSADFGLSDLRAAVLYYEVRPLGLRTGMFTTDDITGFRTVIAQETERVTVADVATKVLLHHGAHVVLTTYDAPETERRQAPRSLMREDVRWTELQREALHRMQLGETYEETMARLGKATRFNMRYYRRRLCKRMEVEFVPDARGMLSDDELVSVNANALNPVRLEECRLRYESSCKQPGGYLMGIRSADGEWLSLVGGWRHESLTVLHWQVNSSSYKKDSIGTVMRAYMLEHEATLGTRKLLIFGGTPHSMRNSFERYQVRELVVKRTSWRMGMLTMMARLFATPRSLSGRVNHLARVLCSDELRWRRVNEPPARMHLVERERDVA